MPAMSENLDVCIRGDGIVGKSLALLLARDGLRVGLVGLAKPAAAADVRAYALNHASRELLKSLRCWPTALAATPVLGMRVSDEEEATVNFSALDQGTEALAWIVDVGALDGLLSEAIGFQPKIERLEQAQNAALTVICEGKQSDSRKHYGVEFQAVAYGQQALAARLTCERPHGQMARQWFHQGEVLASLPMDGPQGHTVAIVWSVAAERAAELQASSPQEFCEALGAASQHAMGALTLCSERANWPLHKAHAQRWSGQTDGSAWVLAGDAAHNVHPLAGQGLNLGLADVAALAHILKTRDYWRTIHDVRLLRRYERERKAGVFALQAGIDGLQILFSHDNRGVAALRAFGMNGFERSGKVKQWVAGFAMGLR
jgi:2-polyprenyl-6-methoxyphenol hydroxylase-like FAD-dependent oxidoreductase